MSSEVEGAAAVVAAAVVATPAVAAVAIAGAVAGAGWVAWKAGQGLWELNRAADRKIAEKKAELQAKANQRKYTALTAQRKVVDLARGALSQLEECLENGSLPANAETAQLKKDLLDIIQMPTADDVATIESLTAKHYVTLDRIARRQQKLLEMAKSASAYSVEQSAATVQMLESLRLGILAMEVFACVGQDVQAADPDVLERAALHERFVAVTDKVVAALRFIHELDVQYGLSPASSRWFTSCFNGVDELVAMLCDPSVSNAQLKRGIARLEDAWEGYVTTADGIEKDAKEKWALYTVYAPIAEMLGEQVRDIRDFKDAAEIEETLHYLKAREEKAEKCAKIYAKLGRKAYLCMALDTSLAKMGYTAHSAKTVEEMLGETLPPRGKTEDGKALPFYQWTDEELAQLYSVAGESSLHVTVDDDGTAYIRVIADKDDEHTTERQQKLCFKLSQELRDILFNDWFISYVMEEKQSAQVVVTVEGWSADERGVRVEGRKNRKAAREQKKREIKDE